MFINVFGIWLMLQGNVSLDSCGTMVSCNSSCWVTMSYAHVVEIENHTCDEVALEINEEIKKYEK